MFANSRCTSAGATSSVDRKSKTLSERFEQGVTNLLREDVVAKLIADQIVLIDQAKESKLKSLSLLKELIVGELTATTLEQVLEKFISLGVLRGKVCICNEEKGKQGVEINVKLTDFGRTILHQLCPSI
jgi:hypothetical protein